MNEPNPFASPATVEGSNSGSSTVRVGPELLPPPPPGQINSPPGVLSSVFLLAAVIFSLLALTLSAALLRDVLMIQAIVFGVWLGCGNAPLGQRLLFSSALVPYIYFAAYQTRGLHQTEVDSFAASVMIAFIMTLTADLFLSLQTSRSRYTVRMSTAHWLLLAIGIIVAGVAWSLAVDKPFTPAVPLARIVFMSGICLTVTLPLLYRKYGHTWGMWPLIFACALFLSTGLSLAIGALSALTLGPGFALVFGATVYSLDYFLRCLGSSFVPFPNWSSPPIQPPEDEPPLG
ncbi:hypothetical protein [Bremerella cremea]|uniref:hypothetical protein n=1 Tax=Bremerella cremea TaxID=1031537 RepID=UPI0031EE4CB7